jgi:hypothetical protein
MNTSHTFWNPKGGGAPQGICRYPRKGVFFFTLRLLLNGAVWAVIAVHPAVAAGFDYESIILFLFCPLEALIAFLPAPKGRFRYKLIAAALPVLALLTVMGSYPFYDLAAPRFRIDLIDFLFVPFFGLVSFGGTLLLFHYPRWGKLAVIEPFLLSFLFLRILRFSRASEEIAAKSAWITPFVLVSTLLSFLVYGAVVYSCLYPDGAGVTRREGICAALGVAALALVMNFLPTDFARNAIITNLLENRADEMAKPSDYEWNIEKDGGMSRQGRKTVPGGEGAEPGLRELSEYDWPREGDGQGKGKGKGTRRGDGSGGSDVQYTVMVAASQTDPVYMGDTFMGLLDPVEGFKPTPEDPLNALTAMRRLLSTWVDAKPAPRRGRVFQEVFSLSALSQNYLPYRPAEVEPTVLSKGTGPLRFIHRVRSFMYGGDPLKLASASIRALGDSEKAGLSLYLEADLAEEDRQVFAEHLAGALEKAGGAEYVGTISAILESFAGFQYNITDDEDASVPALARFLTETQEGDCVQFAHTAALLGRLAGIPSRVVTGYLAAESLQTKAHRRGLAALRSQIKILQDFPLSDLYLVTSAHAHAWPQFYVPEYGWLDFEATQFALPPMGFGDGNARDVVIPRIEENPSQARPFPWGAVGRALALLAAASLAGAYAVRYGREGFLLLRSARGGRSGARALYLLLLARLASDGRPIKPASKTASEYADLFPVPDPCLKNFAALYSEIRWRDFKDPSQLKARFAALQEAYRQVIRAATRRGAGFFLVRIFSLRGLLYL